MVSSRGLKVTKNTESPSKSYNKELFLTLSTAICDYRCIFCSRGSRKGVEKLKYFLHSFDYRKESLSIQDVIYNGHHKHNAKHIIIGGYEPLNHPNIVRIVSFSKKLGYKKITVQTAGLRFSNQDFVERMYNAGLTNVDIPIYGSYSKLHDSIVRLKGGYNLLMTSIDQLKKVKIRIGFHTLLLKQNLHDINNLIKKYENIFIYYPRPAKGSPYSPKLLWVKISHISPSIYKNLKIFKVPCIDSKLFPERYSDKSLSPVTSGKVRVKLSPERPCKILADRQDTDYIPRIKLSKCSDCRYYNHCSGFYSRYFELFGDKEFNPSTKDKNRPMF